ncbi:GTPase-associated protein 1-related protein [Streptomyces sp. VRA16 Mangrove soil]|uniref:GTPase-associated protein 1-related protein n=1 Tax=Streptomyces sp. VRA16 Mangrove soil TaxID=2817434 RepID=UPI001A9F5F90|nr:GTPase-associated protein 1-related protein [Streptomyces sp. VRA16 Mangrove soil]MBO1335479.1 hypothetical protein [Streptomyces sp. VRA16 Mangrove soil]
MTLAQLHCTAVPPGSDGPAFRFAAVSEELPDEVRKEAERLFGDTAPPSGSSPRAAQPAAPSGSFSCSALFDGGRLVGRTVHTPTHSRTHAVHLPAGTRLPDGALPITVWESPSWAVVPPDDGRPAPLERLQPSRLLQPDGLVAFAAERAAHLGPFFADVRAAVADPDAARLVVVERDSADVARWIALACAVLPREQAHRLTFTTYARSPHRAGQQIVGALPGTELPVDDPRYRVHDRTAATAPGATADTWADLCARIWIAGAPRLFVDAAHDLGTLAARALAAGIGLRTDARVAAADWLCEEAGSLSADALHTMVTALCAAPPAAEPSAEHAHAAALAALFTALDGRVPARTSGPLAARVLRAALRDGALPVPRVAAAGLPGEERQRLRYELARPLREGIGDPELASPERALTLLRIADQLDVDCAHLLPELAGRLAVELTGGAAGAALDVRDAVAGHPTLRTALFGALDAQAAAQPAAVAGALIGRGLPVDDERGFPHLRMCAAPLPPGTDRLDVFHALIRGAGVSPHAEPPVLRTACALVWPAQLPDGRDAGLLLSEFGSDTHRAAGTRDLLVDAALAAPADDPHAPALAEHLLRSFAGELSPRRRAGLLLLQFTGLLGTDGEGGDWVGRILALRADADPAPPAVVDRAFRAVARRLLDGPAPPGELYDLIRSGEPELLEAYRRAAGDRTVADRLRASPPYIAYCFSEWSSHSGTDPSWDDTRTALLGKVLRPVVKGLPAADLAQVRTSLDAAGRGKLDAFDEWQRPGKLGRFAGRLTGRGRR